MRHLRLFFLALPLLTTACGTVVFDADFDSDTVGHAPSPAPRVGRIDVSASSGVVDVVYAPGPDAPQSKWVRIMPVDYEYVRV